MEKEEKKALVMSDRDAIWREFCCGSRTARGVNSLHVPRYSRTLDGPVTGIVGKTDVSITGTHDWWMLCLRTPRIQRWRVARRRAVDSAWAKWALRVTAALNTIPRRHSPSETGAVRDSCIHTTHKVT